MHVGFNETSHKNKVQQFLIEFAFQKSKVTFNVTNTILDKRFNLRCALIHSSILIKLQISVRYEDILDKLPFQAARVILSPMLIYKGYLHPNSTFSLRPILVFLYRKERYLSKYPFYKLRFECYGQELFILKLY